MSTEPANEKSMIISYLTLRKAIGIMGLALPIVLYFGAEIIFHDGLQPSLSSYYHTGMGDILVGILVAIGFFLFSYRGYERSDDIAGDLACLFAIGTALFPTAPENANPCAPVISEYVHWIFAALFFITLIYFCLFLFTKTYPDRDMSPEKIKRNRVYRVCGYIMSLCIVLIAVHGLIMSETSIQTYKPVFWLESITVWAFGFAWITKGEAILRDEE